MITPDMETTPPIDRSILPIISVSAIATDSSVSVHACKSMVERLPTLKKRGTSTEAATNTTRKIYVAPGIRSSQEASFFFGFISSTSYTFENAICRMPLCVASRWSTSPTTSPPDIT